MCGEARYKEQDACVARLCTRTHRHRLNLVRHQRSLELRRLNKVLRLVVAVKILVYMLDLHVHTSGGHRERERERERDTHTREQREDL
jgi:hypothetical protein